MTIRRKWTWIAVIWTVVVGGWGVLQTFQLPSVDRLYLPLLLWKNLLPELAVALIIITLVASRGATRRIAERVWHVIRRWLLPPAGFDRRRYFIALGVLLLLMAPFWWSNFKESAVNSYSFAVKRPEYYKLLFIDYYANALSSEADTFYASGEIDKSIQLYRAASKWGGANPEFEDRARRAELRALFARNQADRANAVRGLGLTPLVISLDIDAVRLNPASLRYRRRLAEDQRGLDRIFRHGLDVLEACRTRQSAAVAAEDQAAFDSFAPGSVGSAAKSPAAVDCARLNAVCQTGPEMCLQRLKLHMQADRLIRACDTLTDGDGEQQLSPCENENVTAAR